MKRLLLPCLIALAACGSSASTNPDASTGPTVGSTPDTAESSITTDNQAVSVTTRTGPESSIATSPLATKAPAPSVPPSAPASSNPSNGPRSLTCDADAGSAPTFAVAAGTSVTLVATSADEREFHLHNYDIELSGTRVTFQFAATILGPSQLTLHPGHEVVCTVVVS